MRRPVLCVYHANCADGFTAAWVVNNALKEHTDVEFHPGFYGDNPPDCKDREVIIVDFSYKRDVMERICREAKKVLILDHHKSAIEDLDGLDDLFENTDVVFDFERSGAMIAWEHFNPGVAAPKLVEYVQDRDLWRFELPLSKEFTAGLFSYNYTFANWDVAAQDAEAIMEQGVHILRKQQKDILEFIEANKDRRMEIAGHIVPVINVPYTLGSDACHILCKGEKFAAYYYDLGPDRMFGLRSETNVGMDVSKIAELYGGGGHKHAAGFKLKGFNAKRSNFARI